MTTTMKHKPIHRFAVHIIESERGWGQKVDETRTFATLEDAEKFVKDYNKDLKPGPAPDWYMIAKGPFILPAPKDSQ